jgi:Ca-activated chloride channel family protein
MFDLNLTWDRPARTGSHPSAHTLRVRIVPGSSHGPLASGLPVRMAIALDMSGSMSGEKLIQAKHACEKVIAMLRPDDRLSLAGFSTELLPIIEDLPGGPQSQQIASQALQRLFAVGVTRADVALQWIEKALPPTQGAMRVGIVITDGHPTDPMGGKNIDTRPLVEMAGRMGRAGVTVCAVGLGSAAAFNTAFLSQISDRGHGAFLHAETPAGLEQVLAARLSASQAMAIADAALAMQLLVPGASVKTACRFRPEYIPLDIDQEGTTFRTGIGSVRADTVTDVLLQIDLPAPPASVEGWKPGSIDVIEVRLIGDGSAVLASDRASIQDTASYAEAQRRDSQVEQDRLSWEVNIYSDALMKAQECGADAANPRRTGQLLASMEQSARRAGNEQLASEVAAQIGNLRQTGKLDAGRATGLLTASRNLGSQGSRATGLLDAAPGRATGVLGAQSEDE